MSAKTVILLSDRTEDIAFFEKACAKEALPFQHLKNLAALTKYLAENPKSIVVWDADNEGSSHENHAYPSAGVQITLNQLIPSAYVFALTDKPISLYEHNETTLAFLQKYPPHNIIRSYNPAASSIYATLFKCLANGNIMDFAHYFPAGAKVQQISITESEHRAAAVEAIHNFLAKSSVEKRLCSRIAQASDELLMNAIFDAARDSNNTPTRRFLSRAAKFSLSPNKGVELKAIMTDEYCGICVTDHYGSVNKEDIARYLSQNYHDKDYKIRQYGQGAGLGLYSIVQSGISLAIFCESNSQTNAMIFFPNVNSFKAFKESFQFTMCLGTFELHN